MRLSHSFVPVFLCIRNLSYSWNRGFRPGRLSICATINNARILKQEKNLGSIEAGKLADLVLLRLDPLKDIHNTRSISKVIRGRTRTRSRRNSPSRPRENKLMRVMNWSRIGDL